MRVTAILIALSTALQLTAGPILGSVAAQETTRMPSEPGEPVSPPPSASAGAMAGAVAVNIFRVPGKAMLCGLGTIVASGLMLMTFGTQYRDAGLVFREGCGGKWVIGPADLGRNVDAPKAIFSGEPS
jgi:hypothetical protein